VFCHDVELVSPEDAIEAIGTLFELADQGVFEHGAISQRQQ
jgi:hypothetical protein